MNINGVGVNKVLNIYNDNSRKSVEKKPEVKKSDSVEISDLGKNLSSLSMKDDFSASQEKIDKLREQVKKGTYQVDSSVLASKIMDIIKGNEG